MDFPFVSETNATSSHLAYEASVGGVSMTPLSQLFFSPRNVEALQDGIRYQVYVKSGKQYVIGKQSYTELEIVMRSVYNEYARHMPFDIVGQVRDLNRRVLTYCVDNVLSEIRLRLHYVQEIDTVPMPMERGVNVSSAGSRTLFMREF